MQHRDRSRGRDLDDGPLPWGWRLASALPVLALVVGLWGIHVWYRSEKVQAASDVDMALLIDALPPVAYADPGFEEYLHTEPAVVSAEPTTASADESQTDSNSGAVAEQAVGEAEARP